MFTDNSSTATAQVAEAINRLTSDASMECLREIARKHQVCYEVWPERSVAQGRKIQIGFELQLCGTNSHIAAKGGQQPVPGCEYCHSTYEDLRQIAEWILPREERPSRYDIGGFDRALHVAPHSRQSRSEVVVSIHIMHRADFNRDVDDCEHRCLKEMRDRLNQLGICEGKWLSDAEKPRRQLENEESE
ncbi:MAG TPA: hypothetical protein VI750_11520 [Pyrinomonadaceae bacterium]|nr:hypothetical protein [Pyrinomonadaceae bacterium]